ncbi:MAG: hypothetical protein IK025_00900 [Bacteroidales bacterium]|nr:hypothetical protein [Bacteroidales bacterium]
MRKILLVMFCVVASSLSMLAQVTYEGTLNLRDGTKLTGTITVFTPENGYPTTFYRVDSGTETRYFSENDVAVSDAKRNQTVKNAEAKSLENPEKPQKSEKEKAVHLKQKKLAESDALSLLPRRASATFNLIHGFGIDLTYGKLNGKRVWNYGIGWSMDNSSGMSVHSLYASIGVMGYWRIFKVMHLYLGPSFRMGAGFDNNGAMFYLAAGLDFGLEYDFKSIPLGVSLGTNPRFELAGGPNFGINMNLGVKYLF